MISISKFFKSTGSAIAGLKSVFKTEQNFRIQFYAAILVLAMSIYFTISKFEWMIILLLIMLVLLTEIVNTAIEKFNDLLKPRLHHYVYAIKNIMAGAVLLVSLISFCIGLIIFIPYFINLVK